MNQPIHSRGANQGSALPGWGMLVIGLIIGLFVAFLVYLDRLDEDGSIRATQKPQQQETNKEKPRFEFYSILPELEVVVPDAFKKTQELLSNIDKPNTENNTAKIIYYLQAGSFKNATEADRMKANLSLLGLSVVVQSVTVNETAWHRVRVGPLSDTQTLDNARQRLLENKIEFILLKTKG